MTNENVYLHCSVDVVTIVDQTLQLCLIAHPVNMYIHRIRLDAVLPGVSTTALVFYVYQNGFSYFNMGYASTISSILFILIMAVTLGQFVLQKRWVHYEV